MFFKEFRRLLSRKMQDVKIMNMFEVKSFYSPLVLFCFLRISQIQLQGVERQP